MGADVGLPVGTDCWVEVAGEGCPVVGVGDGLGAGGVLVVGADDVGPALGDRVGFGLWDGLAVGDDELEVELGLEAPVVAVEGAVAPDGRASSTSVAAARIRWVLEAERSPERRAAVA